MLLMEVEQIKGDSHFYFTRLFMQKEIFAIIKNMHCNIKFLLLYFFNYCYVIELISNFEILICACIFMQINVQIFDICAPLFLNDIKHICHIVFKLIKSHGSVFV